MREYPPTSNFPAHPTELHRDELERVYLEIRQHYKGLSISRGQFASKVQSLQQKLEEQENKLSHVMQTLDVTAQQKQELYEVLEDLKAISGKQKALIADLNDEFEAVKNDRTLNVVDRFNRIIRAVYRLLHQDITRPAPKIQKPEADNWDQEDPRNIGKSLLDR